MAEVLQNVTDVSDVDVELLGRVGRQLRDGQDLFLEVLAGGASDAAQQEVGWSRSGLGVCGYSGAEGEHTLLGK